MYRLCKHSSNNQLTIEIEDDDDITFEISDDDDEAQGPSNNDGRTFTPIDIKEEIDLGIQLSRTFNEDIKKELEEFDELENIILKNETSDFFDLNDHYADNNGASFDPHQAYNDNNSEVSRHYSVDSTSTIQINTVDGHEQQDAEISEIDVNDLVVAANITIAGSSVRSISSDGPPSDRTCSENGLQPSATMSECSSLTNEEDGRRRSDHTDSGRINATVTANSLVEEKSSVSNETLLIEASPNQRDSEDNLQRLISEHSERAKKRKGPEIIKVKPLKKRSKTKVEDNLKNGRAKMNNENRSKTSVKVKDKLKVITEKLNNSSHEKPKAEPKVPIIPKVKYTADNRGAFLIDPTQIPGLPGKANTKPPGKANTKPIISHQSISANSDRQKTVQESPPQMEIDNRSTASTPTADIDISLCGPIADIDISLCGPIKKLSFGDLDKYHPNIVHSSNCEDRHESTTNGKEENNEKPTHKTDKINETSFQCDPRHEIISRITSYNYEKHKTVDTFCKIVDSDISSFADTYVDYMEYRR